MESGFLGNSPDARKEELVRVLDHHGNVVQTPHADVESIMERVATALETPGPTRRVVIKGWAAIGIGMGILGFLMSGVQFLERTHASPSEIDDLVAQFWQACLEENTAEATKLANRLRSHEERGTQEYECWLNNYASAYMLQASSISLNGFQIAYTLLGGYLSQVDLEAVKRRTSDHRRTFFVLCENYLWAAYHNYAPWQQNGKTSPFDLKIFKLLVDELPKLVSYQRKKQADERLKLLQVWARLSQEKPDFLLAPYAVAARFALLLGKENDALTFAQQELAMLDLDRSPLAYSGSSAIWSILAYYQGRKDLSESMLDRLQHDLASPHVKQHTRDHLNPMIDGQLSVLRRQKKDIEVSAGYAPNIAADFAFVYRKLLQTPADPMFQYVEAYRRAAQKIDDPNLRKMLARLSSANRAVVVAQSSVKAP